MLSPLLHTPYRQLDSSAERLRDLAVWLTEAASPEMAAAALRAASEIDASKAADTGANDAGATEIRAPQPDTP